MWRSQDRRPPRDSPITAAARRRRRFGYASAMETTNPFARLRDHLSTRLRDRARAHSFFRFVGRRFLDDRLFESAGALSFTTVFALVPLSMVVFGVLSAFPVFSQWSNQLSDYIFSNFVPSSARAVEPYVRQFSANPG